MENYKMYVSVTDHKVYHHPDDSLWDFEVVVPRQYIPYISCVI